MCNGEALSLYCCHGHLENPNPTYERNNIDKIILPETNCDGNSARPKIYLIW